MTSTSPRTPTTTDHDGRSIVLGVYVIVIGIAGLFGFLLGAIGPHKLNPVSLFFLIELPPTAFGLAVYGMATVGVVLGIILLLVRYASRRYMNRDS